RLLAAQLRAVERRFGPEALGVIDLPPLDDSAIEPVQLLSVPPLLWAREVEATGLLAFLDALAEGTARLQIVLPIGDVARELMQPWRARDDRTGPAERQAIYSLLFGGPGSPTPNEAFPELFGRLLSELRELGRLRAFDTGTAVRARIAAVGY